MNKFVLIFILLNLLNFCKCQLCSKPPQMKNFNISVYGNGTWYFHSIMSGVQSSLNYSCARGIGKFNSTHASINTKGRKDSTVYTIDVTARIVRPSIFKMTVDEFTYQGMDINNVDFDYYVLCKYLDFFLI